MAKRLLLTLALALLPCLSMAQVMAVADFHLDAADQTANAAATMVYDQNGEVCALIRIQTTQKGFVFDVGSMGVTKVDENHVGEVWAYLPHGVKRITIRHQQLGTLQDYYFPIAIEKARTYVMQLTTGKVTTVVEQAVSQQFVSISVEPKTALVTLDGQPLQLTDGAAAKMMPFGVYDYRVDCKMYHPQMGKLTVNDPDNTVTLAVTLKPAYGWIDVTSSTADGGDVYIDDERVGTAPYHSGPIASGSHSLRIVKALYNAYSTTVTVTDGQHSRLSPALTANYARLSWSVAGNAEIWINGSKAGAGLVTGNYATGSYRIETRKANHRSASQTIDVNPGMSGQTITLQEPTPITGTLLVNSTPVGASITLDGQPVGQTPRQITQLLVGTHSVKLTKPGYADYVATVTLEEGKTANLTATLQNVVQVSIICNVPTAKIYCDGTYLGTGSGTYPLSMGSHTLIATADNYKDYSAPIQVTSATTSHIINLQPKSNDRTITVGGVTFKMVYVEGGTFTMGATSEQGDEAHSDEKPTHSVSLSSYYIGETEVTQALWHAVMGSEPTYNGGWEDQYGRGSNYPAYRVSYEDCQAFIRKLNNLTAKIFRLPTEAEWEYAARGGNKSRGYKYSGSNTLSDVAWNYDNSGNKTHPVKIKSPNELGLYDMSGNVWEWCQDWYDDYSSSSQTNPKGPSTGSNRVYRGGGWLVSARNCRVSLRGSGSPSSRYYYIGLRLVMEP